MTDWDRVERLRARGMSWSEIAEDDKVEFTAPPGTEKPGLALKSLYFQRRSRRQRQASRGDEETGNGRKGEAKEESPRTRRRRRNESLAFVGMVIALVAAIPLGLGFAVTLIPTVVPLLYLGLVAVVGLAILGTALVLGSTRALDRWKRGVAVGIVVGLLFALVLVVSAYGLNCPNLNATTHSAPSPSNGGTWVSAHNPVWTANGAPILFFYGSSSCPYCSASSWAVEGAVRDFGGSFSPVTYGSSSSTDVFPGTPEIVLAGTSTGGNAISWDPWEDTTPGKIVAPNPGCPEKAYVAAYDGQGSIPFVVVGGVYVHSGSLVDPGCLSQEGCGSNGGTALSAQQVQSDINGKSGVDYNAIITAQNYLEAYMWKADDMAHVTPPATVTSNNAVIAIYNTLPNP